MVRSIDMLEEFYSKHIWQQFIVLVLVKDKYFVFLKEFCSIDDLKSIFLLFKRLSQSRNITVYEKLLTYQNSKQMSFKIF